MSTFLGNESVKEAIQGQTKVADANAELQTFQTQLLVFQSDELQLGISALSSDTEVAKTAKQALDSLSSDEKQADEQQKKLEEKVKEQQTEVTHANDQHLLYEIAEVLLQIAIVLASVAIIAARRLLLYGGHLVAVVGVVFLVLGFAK